MDLENSVILPMEDFTELQATAFGQNLTPRDRVANVATTTIMVFVFAGAITAGSYGVAKVMDWKEERKFQREMRKAGLGTTTK